MVLLDRVIAGSYRLSTVTKLQWFGNNLQWKCNTSYS